MNDNMEIEPATLEAWIKDSSKTNPRLIDCREPEERLICHIDASELIPLNKIEAAITEWKSNYKEKESFARLYSQSVVMLDVVKKSGENLLTATEKINKIMTDAQNNIFPEGLIIVKTNNF